MRTQLLIRILLLLTFTQVLSQSKAQTTLHSYEAGLELGSGGGDYGLQIKANHNWLENDKLTLLSGLQYATFWGSERSESGDSQSSGFTTDNHLKLFTGTDISLFGKLDFKIEGYVGGYHAFTKGDLNNETFGISRSYRTSSSLFDFGSRIGFGYQLKEFGTIQLTVTNSWRQADSGLGFLAGLFAGEPDGKMSVGFSFKKRL